MSKWLEVSVEGLRKLMERRGKSVVVMELLQNSLDAGGTTEVDIEITRVPNSPFVELKVIDDAPGGFDDLRHAWVMYSESAKKAQVTKRGRFCFGEKAVLSMCSEAVISSTSGTVVFDEAGRRRTKKRTEKGSVFWGRLRMTADEVQECDEALQRVIVPEGIAVRFNGRPIESRSMLKEVGCSLQTEIADDEGCLRRTTRTTTVRIYDASKDGGGWLYEMGLPVMETCDRWHVDVQQKVPLNMDRDGVSQAYLAKIRTVVVNAMAEAMTQEDATSTWVKDAVGRHSGEITETAARRLADLRFGEKRVAFDPSDAEANKIAAAEGYTIVHGSQLSGSEWEVMRRAGAIAPAGRVTPSPRPYSGDGSPLKVVSPERWTPRMKVVAEYSRTIARELLGLDIEVVIVSDVGWGFVATYGGRVLTLNLGKLGHRWFEGPLEPINDLLLHELAHEAVQDHLSRDFYRELTRLGAKMTSVALRDPSIFVLP